MEFFLFAASGSDGLAIGYLGVVHFLPQLIVF
jgi:hypothetical protein